jgi:uncharacterized protein YdeI (YjbR/CyaY-like superfamily)
VTAAEAGDVALCFGWIDSQRKSHDDAYFLQKYTPRQRGARGRGSTSNAPRR